MRKHNSTNFEDFLETVQKKGGDFHNLENNLV